MYTQEELTAMKTGYGQALMDPKNGPLVGVPQFVPVETHRERVKIVASVSTTGGDGTIILNPYALGTDCSSDITGNVAASTVNSFKPLVFAPAASITDTTASGILHFESNASTKPTEFADGAVKARLVSARLAVTNTSSLNSRNGTFCALRERHHHGLDGVDFDEASRQSNAVVKSATAGTVAINYRPVKPEEVDSWLEVRTSPSWGHLMLPGDIMNGPNDAGIMDVSPGFMGVWIKGSGAQTFLVEVDAIFEYCGDSRTSLVKPIHIGHRNKAEPKHIAPVGKGVDKANTTQGTEQGANATLHTYKQPELARGEDNTSPDTFFPEGKEGTDYVVKTGDAPAELQRYFEVRQYGDGSTWVWVNGTPSPFSSDPNKGKDWWRNFKGTVGIRDKETDVMCTYLHDSYGMDSDVVHYSGYSYGGGVAAELGGRGVGAFDTPGMRQGYIDNPDVVHTTKPLDVPHYVAEHVTDETTRWTNVVNDVNEGHFFKGLQDLMDLHPKAHRR